MTIFIRFCVITRCVIMDCTVCCFSCMSHLQKWPVGMAGMIISLFEVLNLESSYCVSYPSVMVPGLQMTKAY